MEFIENMWWLWLLGTFVGLVVVFVGVLFSSTAEARMADRGAELGLSWPSNILFYGGICTISGLFIFTIGGALTTISVILNMISHFAK